MEVPLSILQVLALVLAGLFLGAGLLMMLFGWLASLGGDNSGTGCMGIGLVLLAAAAFIAFRVVVVA